MPAFSQATMQRSGRTGRAKLVHPPQLRAVNLRGLNIACGSSDAPSSTSALLPRCCHAEARRPTLLVNRGKGGRAVHSRQGRADGHPLQQLRPHRVWGDQHVTSTSSIASVLNVKFNVPLNLVHFPKDFLMTFIHLHHREAVANRGSFRRVNLDLHLKPWILEAHAEH